MSTILHHCKRCGGSLTLNGQEYTCNYCRTKYPAEVAERNTANLQELFDAQKQEIIHNLRRILYDAITTQYISRKEVIRACDDLRVYLPDDFLANFFKIAAGTNVRAINQAICEIDVEEFDEYLEMVLTFLIKSITADNDYLLSLNDLIERAYKKRNLPQLFSKYATMISEQTERVQTGVYETGIPRHVFVAYSSKDMATVIELTEALEAQGITCFVAARNLKHGIGSVENYDAALKEAINNCQSVVFVSSMNSRNFGCDALKIELAYIQATDIQNAPPEYRNNYSAMPHRYKKPRVEYRIEESTRKNIGDTRTDQFFNGYERVYDIDGVLVRLMAQLFPVDEDFSEPASGTTQAPPPPAPEPVPPTPPAPDPIPPTPPAPDPIPPTPPVQDPVPPVYNNNFAQNSGFDSNPASGNMGGSSDSSVGLNLSGISVGGTVTFGNYQQSDYGTSPIEWTVLAKEGNRALLISKYILDCEVYHEDDVDVTWETCTLRRWMNGYFLDKAFTRAEQGKILVSRLTTPNHPTSGTWGGNETFDKVFCLSVDEAIRYFTSDSERQCAPTEYALSKDVFESDGYCYWWLRSPGEQANFATEIRCGGTIRSDGETGTSTNTGIRPAIWVTITPDQAGNSGGQSYSGPVEGFDPNALRVGSTFKFGNYEQGFGVAPIDWIVLANEGNRALVVSMYALDCEVYHPVDTAITWENCSLRRWMNQTFLNAAFTPAEQSKILESYLTTPNHPTAGTYGGNPTTDKIFCLSVDEVSRYFSSDEARKCKPSPYAISKDVFVSGSCAYWWLRSPGEQSNFATEVNSGGGIRTEGETGTSSNTGIRPAMWVALGGASGGMGGGSYGSAQNNAFTGNNPAFGGASAPSAGFNPNSVSIGSTITFGSYNQGGYGKTPIEWLVLARDGDRALVISKHILDCQVYHTRDTSVTWETCSLRQWMNSTFLSNAFSPAEQARIAQSHLFTPNHPTKGTPGGNVTADKIFCLSVDEATRYFTSDSQRSAGPTDYARSLNVFVTGEGKCYWWLRSPGEKSNFATEIRGNGSIRADGETGTSTNTGIRPAMWILANGNASATSTPPQAPMTPPTSGGLDPRMSVGSVVSFGMYPQGGSIPKPIEWLVLANEGNRALLISKHILDCEVYNSDDTSVTWETSTLRRWLNRTFFGNAFSPDEQNAVLQSQLSTFNHPTKGTPGGNATSDKVFCLSVEEATRYFASDSQRSAGPTDYARSKNVFVTSEGKAYWWLRSPGEKSNFATEVRGNGSIRSDGETGTSTNTGIRPAIWVALGASAGSSPVSAPMTPPAFNQTGGYNQTPVGGFDPNSVPLGGYITFGNYDQGYGRTPIEWYVVAKEANRALVVSRYILDCEVYHTSDTPVTWEYCWLRQWMNQTFLNAAFTPSEQARILTSRLTTPNHPVKGTPGGNPTNDKIFCLSVDEANDYFLSDEARRAEATQYALDKDVYVNDGCAFWWLRSPGEQANFATEVRSGGSIRVDGETGTSTNTGIRPAMWIALDASRAQRPSASSASNLRSSAMVGGTVRFGNFEQNGGRSPIEWLVLAREGNRALLITKYVIDCQLYNTSDASVTWETCSLRRWMNTAFLNAAFDTAEQARIISTRLRNPDNPQKRTRGGNDTMDKVFCLSIEEAQRYFNSDAARRATPTQYAKNNDVFVASDGYAYWWLRTPGEQSNFATEIRNNGTIRTEGESGTTTNTGLRPAIWVSLD